MGEPEEDPDFIVYDEDDMNEANALKSTIKIDCEKCHGKEGVWWSFQTRSADEPETRLAWMEHIAEVAECPDCQAPIGVVERSSGPQIQCSVEPEHLNWPE